MDGPSDLDTRLALLLPLVESITSAADLDEVLGRVVCSTASLVDDSVCTVWVAEDSRLVARVRGGARRSGWTGRSEFAVGEGLVGHAALERRTVLVDDVRTDPRTCNRDYFEAEGLVAAAVVPLVSRDHLVGVLALFTRRADALGPTDVAMLTAFGGHAAIAIENTRLYADSERRRREAETLADIARELVEARDLDAVLGRITEGARTLCESDVAALARREADGAFAVGHVIGARTDAVRRLRTASGRAVGGRTVVAGGPSRIADGLAGPPVSPEWAAALETEGVSGALVAPIVVGEAVEGLLYACRRTPRAFSASDESVLLRLADQAATAIHAGALFVAEQTARREAETAARRFEGLVDALDAIVLEGDDALRVSFINRRAEEILGYPRERWYADPDFWVTHVHPDDRERTVTECRVATAQNRDHVLEYRMRAADGRTVWLHDTVRVLPAGADGRRRVRCVMVDITERKRGEALLAGEREILARIAEGAPVAAVLDGLCRLIESQHPPLRASILLVAAGGRLRHGAAPTLPEPYVRAIDGLAIGPGAGSCGTAAYLRKPVIVSDIATDPLWTAYRQFALPHGLRACWSSPVLDAAGEVMATFAVYHAEPRPPRPQEIELVHRATQITRIALERERASVALEVSEERHRALLTHIPALTWLADAGGRILFVSPNSMRIVGYTPEELAVGGRDVWLDRVHRDDAAAVRAAFEALGARGASFDVEYRMRHKSGRWIWIRDRAVSSYEHDGVVYVTGVCTDITERKQAEAVRSRLLRRVVRVQEAERERLARELHDETAQSLAALLIGLQRLPAAPTAAEARRQIARLHEVATRVLAEVGRMARALRPRALDVLGLLPALERYAAELGEMRGLAITVEAAGLEGQRLPPEVEITLYRIMQEALSNVARHAGASKAAVTVERRAASVTMTVADDGRGFDVAAALRAIDERTGLGLHGIRERAAVLRGTVEFLSEPGRGTRVVAEIPLPGDAS